MIKVEFSEQEATALAQLIDVAVKAKGLEVADVAMLVIGKLRAGLATAKMPQEDG